jgi:hypothetical protein
MYENNKARRSNGALKHCRGYSVSRPESNSVVRIAQSCRRPYMAMVGRAKGRQDSVLAFSGMFSRSAFSLGR